MDLVKELRLTGVRTIEQANEVVDTIFLPWFNRCCTINPASGNIRLPTHFGTAWPITGLQSSLHATARKIVRPAPTRAFTFELSSHESRSLERRI
jgi:hypothetical protein